MVVDLNFRNEREKKMSLIVSYIIYTKNLFVITPKMISLLSKLASIQKKNQQIMKVALIFQKLVEIEQQ